MMIQLDNPIGLDDLYSSSISMADINNANEETDVPVDPRLADWKDKKKELLPIDLEFSENETNPSLLESRMSDIDIDMNV